MFNITTSHDLVKFTSHPYLTSFASFTSYPNLTSIASFLCLILLLILSNIIKRNKSCKVFLVDFACYKPPTAQICNSEMFLDRVRSCEKFSEASLVFMQTILEKAGLGQSTYTPEAFLRKPMNPCLEDSRREAEMVMFGAVDELLAKSGVEGKDIGIVIVNCSIFNVVPSLCAMIVNRYKLGEDTVSYNLSGMGCSAGLIAIGLAKQLLQVRHNSYALVVSTENITQNCYFGNDRSKLLSNCIFRIGGAVMLLTNRPSVSKVAKYQLIHTVHNNTTISDRSYNCVFYEEDHRGQAGVTITKDLMVVASKTIEANVITLGRLVLPIREQILYVTNYIIKRFVLRKVDPYVPNFKKAFDHIITHVGGKPVLDEVKRKLDLTKSDMEASTMTLYRFGNTSSSSVWYGLAYAEAKGKIKRGDRAWQIAFGAGFKCSSVIWRAIKTVDREKNNPWSDEIDGFPVDVDLDISCSIPYHFEPSEKI
ncbi:FAE1_CUT1_RppA domain-containing protein/ACP_syn_III_C domain-containing protein [Cephalotus follicularis]|uniref:3-ketoacyl-CoA synthase n=1 Tax=Cephalotus follicularis TaxID=3775 RepID=A0A1Q3D7P4_CEPFO|nr:FAE1_CUT1_RppA domain-containing protein/ACP_syn_III_C domain-containing protein [Cephalotus follicularis]